MPRQQLNERQAATVAAPSRCWPRPAGRGRAGGPHRPAGGRAGGGVAGNGLHLLLVKEPSVGRALPPRHRRPDASRVGGFKRHRARAGRHQSAERPVRAQPARNAAANVALLGSDPDVERLQLRIGGEFVTPVRRRARREQHPGARRRTRPGRFSGALLQAGMGLITYSELGDRLDTVVATILETTDDNADKPSRCTVVRVRSLRLRDPRGSLSVYARCAPRRRSTATRREDSGRCRATPTCSRGSATSRFSNRKGVIARPGA